MPICSVRGWDKIADNSRVGYLPSDVKNNSDKVFVPKRTFHQLQYHLEFVIQFTGPLSITCDILLISDTIKKRKLGLKSWCNKNITYQTWLWIYHTLSVLYIQGVSCKITWLWSVLYMTWKVSVIGRVNIRIIFLYIGNSQCTTHSQFWLADGHSFNSTASRLVNIRN